MDRKGNVTNGKSTKNNWDAQRTSAPNMMVPESVVIRGLDTDDKPDAKLVDLTETRHGRASIERLAKSILLPNIGQIMDVTVMKDGDQAVVTDGRRRVLAFRLINEWIAAGDPRGKGLTEPLRVRARTKGGSDNDHMAVMVVANEHAVPDPPMVKARKAAQLEALGKSVDDIATMFGGVSEQTVKNWLKLAGVHDDLQKAADDGVVATDVVLALANKPRAEQQAKLAELLEEAAAKGVAMAESGGDTVTTRPVRVTGRQARAAARGDENPRPSIRQINKILQAVKQDELDISEIEPEKMLKWVAGIVPHSQMKGFTKVLEG